jgi:ABC-type Zn uptake system ZnuABC Zn-binding protein ZnuA
MRKALLATAFCASLVLSGCSKTNDNTTSDSVSQPSEELNQNVADDSASEAAIGTCINAPKVSGKTLNVVTTVSPITSIAGILAAGAPIKVTGIIPEGTNSHTFEPPPSAAKTLASADLIIVNGLNLEDPVKTLAEANKKEGAVICEVGTAVLPKSEWVYDFSFPEDAGKPNPHAWTNPPHVLRYVDYIRRAMTSMLPSTIPVVDANYVKLSNLVTSLDTAMQTATATVPVRNRKLLTYHDSFAYFARHFKYEVIGAIQPQSFSDPSPTDVADIIAQVKQSQVPAIFGSEVFPSPVLEQIGKETGVKYVDSLRDDDLPGDPGAADHSWAGLMQQDFITIVKNLGGDASAVEAVKIDLGLKDKAYYPQ